MNEQQKGTALMWDRSEAEAVLARTAVAAFTYYPDKVDEEPGYAIAEDVDWVLAVAGPLDEGARSQWQQRVADVIAEPTPAHRRAFLADLVALAEP